VKIAGYEIHPLAECWPRIEEGTDWNRFCRDVSCNGVVVPPIADQHGRIIDGVNRLLAWEHCAEKDPEWADQHPLEIKVTEFPCGDDGLALEHHILHTIISLNEARRHISLDQRTMICTAMIDLMNAEAVKRKTQFKPGTCPNTDGRKGKKQVNPEVGSPVSGEKPKRDIKKMKANSSAGKLAAAAKVPHHLAEKALKIKKESPGLAAEVSAGKITIREAVKKITPPSEPEPKRVTDDPLDDLLILMDRLSIEELDLLVFRARERQEEIRKKNTKKMENMLNNMAAGW
jgi:hypothetical protein